MTNVRPLLLIDIDGVLNPGHFPGEPPDGFVEHSITVDDPFGRGPRTVNVILSAQHGAWLRELAKDFELAWMTTWSEQANEHIAPRLGLPPLRVVRPVILGMFDPVVSKLNPVRQAARGRPAAWLDDQSFYGDKQWARNRNARGYPTLLIRTDYEIGLTAEHVAQLKAFAAGLKTNARTDGAQP